MSKMKKYKAKDGLAPKTKKAVKKIVKTMLTQETEFKQHTAGFSFTPIWGTAGGSIVSHMTAITQNIGDNNRVGDEVTLKHIKVRGAIQNNFGVGANFFNDVRIIVFQYLSQDNSPVANELLTTNQIAGGQVSSYSARFVDYRDLYHVLYDKVHHLTLGQPLAGNNANSDSYSKYFEFTVPLKYAKKKIQYEAGTAASVNGIYFFAIGGTASVAANPTIAAQWEVSYTDS